MIGLSFLGTGNYSPTTYKWGEKAIETSYFPVVLKEIFHVDTLYLVMTKEAKQKHGQNVSAETDYVEIMVPSGKDEIELWQMFSAITEHIPEEADLIMDVTHGFRTQPMLALAAVIFLRVYKRIKIKGIYYGAWEAKTDENQSPVFDLTAFLDVIDWTFAIRRYQEKGDADELSQLLNYLQKRTHIENLPYKAKSLSGLGNHLDTFMTSMSLIRVGDVVEESKLLLKLLGKSQSDLDQVVQTKPMALILDEITDRISQYSLNQEEVIFSPNGFHVQCQMLQHYLKTKQYQQALTLAEEIIISMGCIKANFNPSDIEKREEISKRLNGIIHKEIHAYSDWEEKITELLKKTKDYRNDLNHAGMRKAPKSTKSIIRNTETIVQETIMIVENSITDSNAS